MPKKWTSTSAMAEFKRREEDILKRHRMPTDMNTDLQELLQVRLPGNNGNGGGEQPQINYGQGMQ